MNPLGRHLLLDFYDCRTHTLSNARLTKKIMTSAAKFSKAHIVDVVFHTYNPHGVSGVVIIRESHLAIHTWPEHAFASVDIFTCGQQINPQKIQQYLQKHFQAKKVKATIIPRGF